MISTDTADRCRWYVVQTKRNQEARAESNLRSWSIQTLAPRLRKHQRSTRGEPSNRLIPLFPSYLFARFDAEALFAKVSLTRGVQRVVGFGECATPVDDSIMALIQSRMSEDGIVTECDLRPGDRVEMCDGPLRSMTGVFERSVPASDRVVVFLNALAYSAHVHLARSSVRTSSSPTQASF